MAIGRMIRGVAFLAAAGAAEAAAPWPVRLTLSLHAIGNGPEVAYHPNRWLTIRRSISFARPGAFHDEPNAAAPIAPLRKAEALTGDIHPFGNGLRLSLGFRQDKNRRLLRMRGDVAETPTARLIPMMAAGLAREVVPSLSIAADVGFLGRALDYAGSVQLVTPIEQSRARKEDRHQAFAQIFAAYRF